MTNTLTPDVLYVAPLRRGIAAPSCPVDCPSEYHAIADDALDVSPLEVDQYFITLQRLDIWQDPEALHPGYTTLELTLELRRLPSPAKPRIEDWLSNELPGWDVVQWAMAEPDDDDEPMWF